MGVNDDERKLKVVGNLGVLFLWNHSFVSHLLLSCISDAEKRISFFRVGGLEYKSGAKDPHAVFRQEAN